jgi:hypothetical protein
VTGTPPVALRDYDRVQRSMIVLRASQALRQAEDAEGDLKEIEAAAKALGEVSGVPEPHTGLTALKHGDRKLTKRLLERALAGAKLLADSDEGQAIAAAVEEGYYDGATNPLKLIVADLPTSKARLELEIEHVESELRRREARRRADAFEAEEAASAQVPVDVDTLAEMLKRPDTERWRIEGLLPAEGRALVVAQRKVGKTTLVNNLAASLVTGEPFLGTMPVEQVSGKVMLLNYEVSGTTFARWLGDLNLPKKAARRIVIVNLRGRENLLATDEGRARLASLMREHEVEVLGVDPFGRAFSGDNQDSNSQVTPWLNALDRTATEGGASEVILVAHAGWGGGDRGQVSQVRARGASALEDWADSIVRYSRDGDARYLEAEGRDVLVDKDRLAYDAETRRLTLTGDGGPAAARRAGKATELAEPILAIVRATQGIGASGIGDALRSQGIPFSKGDESAAITSLVAAGALERYKVGRVARHYTPGKAPDKVAGVTTL